jgi:hypothetical protein
MKKAERKLKPFATLLPPDLHDRLRCESIRTNTPIQTLVASALDRFIPADVRVVGGNKSRRNASATRLSG